MAITLADFTKIWASTSPLTPYSFSESNYKEGWNFIGGTPPARQMWDFIQKQNDEKMKYIVDNFLPTSGGTMTGNITLADGGNPLSTAGGTMTGDLNFEADLSIKSSADNQSIGINGGTAWNKGAWMSLWGKDNADYPGYFGMHATDGTNDYGFVGKPNGDLTWDGKRVAVQGGLVNGHGIVYGKTPADISVSANSYKTGNISFGVTFASAPIVIAMLGSGHANVFAAAGQSNITTTGFQYIISNGTSNNFTNESIIWVAIG